MQQQLGYILGRLQIFLEIDEDMDDSDFLADIISNAHLNNSFLALAREVCIISCYYVLIVVLQGRNLTLFTQSTTDNIAV